LALGENAKAAENLSESGWLRQRGSTCAVSFMYWMSRRSVFIRADNLQLART